MRKRNATDTVTSSGHTPPSSKKKTEAPKGIEIEDKEDNKPSKDNLQKDAITPVKKDENSQIHKPTGTEDTPPSKTNNETKDDEDGKPKKTLYDVLMDRSSKDTDKKKKKNSRTSSRSKSDKTSNDKYQQDSLKIKRNNKEEAATIPIHPEDEVTKPKMAKGPLPFQRPDNQEDDIDTINSDKTTK